MSASFYEFEIQTIIKDLNLTTDRVHIKFIPERKTYAGNCTYNTYTKHAFITICNDLDYQSLIEVIMHEAMHAQQYFQGRLKSAGWEYTWLGKKYNYIDNTLDSNYKFQPWEIEAEEYESKFDILFPGRKLIGKLAGVGLYKLGRV